MYAENLVRKTERESNRKSEEFRGGEGKGQRGREKSLDGMKFYFFLALPIRCRSLPLPLHTL
jgi:hypothetical protein